MCGRCPLLVVASLLAAAAQADPAVGAGRPPLSPPLLLAAGSDVAAELRASQRRTDAALARRASLAGLAARADAARDAAANDVTALKAAPGRDQRRLEAALRAALEADERAAAARSDLAGADAAVARHGAELLALYDRLLVVRRGAVDGAPAARRADAVASWRALVAQRDAIRRALAPVLAPDVSADDRRGTLRDLDVDEDDDVEALLEKVDLARDLEARLRRRADAVRARIRELRDERAVAADVDAAVGRASLFDEEDRRLLLNRADLATARTDSARNAAPAPPTSTVGRPPAAAEFDGDASPVGPSPPMPPTPTTSMIVAVPGMAERGYIPGTGGALGQPVGADDSSLAALQALEARLQDELRAVAQKQAALKKATAARSSTTP